MPTVTLPDGTNYFIDSDDPNEIQNKIAQITKQKLSPEGSTLGNIGKAVPAGLIGAVQGASTIPTTFVDLLFNTEVTDNVNEFFDSVKPDVEGTAGKTVEMLVQFGVPGLGTVKALSGLSKAKQVLAVGAVDAAVATDNIDTFADMFDKENDEERIKNLAGREAAAARLKERLQVFAETSAFVYGAPKVLGGAVKLAGGGLDLAAPYFNALAMGLDNKFGAVAAAEKANKGSWDWLRRNFTYGGTYEQTAKNNRAIMDVTQAQKSYASDLTLAVGENMDKIQKTIISAFNYGGKLNADDALDLVKSITAYRTPLTVVERDFPALIGDAKKAKMTQIQNEALKKIKTYEGSGNKIDYKELGVDPDNYLSSILNKNKELFSLEQQLLSDLIVGKDSIPGMTLDDGFKQALKDNIGKYGTTLYRQILDPGFQPAPDVYKRAIDKIVDVFELPKTDIGVSQAKQIFKQIADPENYKGAGGEKTPELYVNNIKSGLLKGKKLKSLPEIREALGEITPLNYKKGSEWKQALEDEAFASTATMSKIATLVGDIKAFDEIKILNDTAKKRGTTTFLKTPGELEAANINTKDLSSQGKKPKLLDSVEVNGVNYQKFGPESGVLQDMYAPEVFVKALGETAFNFKKGVPDILQNAYKGLLALKTVGQYNKTLLSIGAHIRNNTSVPIMAMMNGNLGPSGSFVDAFKKSFAGVFDPRAKTKYQKELKESRDYKINVGRGFQLQEIADVGTYAIQDVGLMEKLKTKGVTSQLQKFRNNFLKPIERTYTGSDNAARWVNWNGEQYKLSNAIANSADDAVVPVIAVKNITDPTIRNLIEIGPSGREAVVNVGKLKAAGDDVVERFIKGEGADIALNVTPTYSRVPEIVKTLKFIPLIGNFTAFPAEIFRNMGNTLQRSIKELASTNPELQKIGIRRLTAAMTTTVGLPTGLVAAGKALTGSDQEQIDAYKRSFAAPWEKTATMIPTETDAAGNITGFINYSYTNPYDFLQRPVKAVLNAVSEGDRNEASLMNIAANATTDAIGEMADPFVSPSLGFNALLEARQGRTDTGKIIYNESDTLGDRSLKQAIHVFNAIAPTALPVTIQKDAEGTQFVPKDFITAVASIATGEKDLISPKGRPIDVAETLTAAFTGVKTVRPQLKKSLYYKAAESKRAIRETTNEFNRLLRSNSERDSEAFIKGYINTNKDRYNSLRDLYTAIEDARTLGLSDYEIKQQLKIAKVADRDKVMMGIFKPSEIDPDVLSFAKRGTESKAAQDVPVSELLGTRLDLTGQSLQGQFEDPRQQPVAPPVRRAANVLREEEINKILTGRP
jgi:hypothetical protein